jgi:pimeloyl-ACP methyl ester carboxylesterase
VARLELTDESGAFVVTRLEVPEPRGTVLFAVGAGGNPERHLPLLSALSERGFTVVAPHFERITPTSVTGEDLLLRARRLRQALDSVAAPDAAVIGVGHSIGATMLVALAGGQVWMGAGHRLSIDPDERLRKLVLLTPTTGFFQAPGALDDVRVPILAWAGAKDTITPPSHAELLKQALQDRGPVEVRIEPEASHFSFMHVPPPNVVESLADRDEFLARLTAEVIRLAEE